MSTRHLQLVEREPGPPRAAQGALLRVAIATRDLATLDAHFGSAPKFAVYEVTPDSKRLVDVFEFAVLSDQSGAHASEGEDRIGPKVQALRGCHLLFVLAIGGPAAAQVVRAKIHPVKLPATESIESILGRVQTLMAGTPPPWLRKAMLAASGPSLEDLEAEPGGETGAGPASTREERAP
jgi:nitrogen fixation protein NifX